MKILSIDTASKLCSVSILENTTLLKKITLDNGLTHSETLMPTISKILEQTNLALSDINLFVCDKGPGSFTGIRIGIATVMGFSDSLCIPCVGISSLESLAYMTNSQGLICSLIDAKHDNVYYGLFYYDGSDYILKENLASNSLQDTIEHLKTYKSTPITFVGDGAISYKEKLQKQIPNSNFNNQNDLDSYYLGLAGIKKYQEGNLEPFLPLYLKKSQAERQLEGLK